LHIKLPNGLAERRPTVVYSHGNSSDISDAYLFFQRLLRTETLSINVCLYDYSGYGISKFGTITEESLCEDLRMVIRYLGLPESHIILWGFSLGSFPTISVGAGGNFVGIILQSPIASAACYFDEEAK
jgi:pimeloyl-ACP methyl ester carboxylesterase